MRASKYPPEEVEEICLEALKQSKSMSKAIALFYQVDMNVASTLIAKVRNMGYDIPVLRIVDQTEWEEKRRNLVDQRRRLIYGGTRELLDETG